MRVIRSPEEFDERDLTVDEIKDAVRRAHASFEEYVSLGELDQAREAYEARDNLLLALAEKLKPQHLDSA